jgi:hypothetical protein
MLSIEFRPRIIFLGMMDFLFKENRLCVPNCSMHELLIRGAHEGGLMGHFEIVKTLEVLHEYFY